MGHPVISAVIWDDARYEMGEATAEEALALHRPKRCTTIGIILLSNEKGVTLAGEIDEDGTYRNRDFIPRVLIIDEFEIGPLRKRQHRNRKVPQDVEQA